MRRIPEPHKSSRQALKAADIDLAIQPVVAWLNSFETVLAQHSCEGCCVQDRDAPRPGVRVRQRELPRGGRVAGRVAKICAATQRQGRPGALVVFIRAERLGAVGGR